MKKGLWLYFFTVLFVIKIWVNVINGYNNNPIKIIPTNGTRFVTENTTYKMPPLTIAAIIFFGSERIVSKKAFL